MDFENFLIREPQEDLLSLAKESLATKEDIELLTIGDSLDFNSFSRDSGRQIEHFMSLIDMLELPEPQTIADVVLEPKCYYKKGTIKKQKSENSLNYKSQNKIKKIENSPYHNYQKHLNNALKKLVVVPAEDGYEPYKNAARAIWAAYMAAEVKTKRILHSVFNEKNEHEISQSQLKSYGLQAIYQLYGREVILLAKAYLSKLAIDQIEAKTIEDYVKTRKIKKTQGFTEYVLKFRRELQSGYIKKRLNLDGRLNLEGSER